MISETRLKRNLLAQCIQNSRSQSGFRHGLINKLGKDIFFSVLLYVMVSFSHRLTFCGRRKAIVSLVLISLYFNWMERVKTFVSTLSAKYYFVSFALLGLFLFLNQLLRSEKMLYADYFMLVLFALLEWRRLRKYIHVFFGGWLPPRKIEEPKEG